MDSAVLHVSITKIAKMIIRKPRQNLYYHIRNIAGHKKNPRTRNFSGDYLAEI